MIVAWAEEQVVPAPAAPVVPVPIMPMPPVPGPLGPPPGPPPVPVMPIPLLPPVPEAEEPWPPQPTASTTAARPSEKAGRRVPMADLDGRAMDIAVPPSGVVAARREKGRKYFFAENSPTCAGVGATKGSRRELHGCPH